MEDARHPQAPTPYVPSRWATGTDKLPPIPVDAYLADLRALERDAVPHNLIAHPLLILCPPLGRWLHDRTQPTVPRRPHPCLRASHWVGGRVGEEGVGSGHDGDRLALACVMPSEANPLPRFHLLRWWR